MTRPRDEEPLQRAAALLSACKPSFASEANRVAVSMELAGLLAVASRNAESVVDRQRRIWLGRLCSDAAGQAFVSAVADRAHRSNDTARTADTVRWLTSPRLAPPP